VDFIGAADAFVGGFVAAHCRRLSVTQSVLWAHAAGNLSLSERGAQSSLASAKQARC
jgi:sugar/nucleoside kinase (ribokinase family)